MDNLNNSGFEALVKATGVFLAIFVVAALLQMVPTLSIDLNSAFGIATAIFMFVALIAMNWKKIWS